MAKQHYPWHQNALRHVTAQLRENRQPHATLFRLRSGYGDTILGEQIVQRLLCDSDDACGKCKHCHLLIENAHPNVLSLDVINAKVGINDIRQLEQQMWRTSMFDKPKVATIHGMDLLSLGAQNALLKTLEEPPENTFFVLSIQNLSRVLPTIMSRVQRLRHGRVEQHVILDWLHSQRENTQTETEIVNVAKLANFAPLPALELLTSPEGVAQLSREKALFADFIAGKCPAFELTAQLDKTEVAIQLTRYSRYCENMIDFLFNKSNQASQSSSDSQVRYPRWNGVSLRDLYRLHDNLLTLRHLADTNVDLSLQMTTQLTDWQHASRS